MTGFKMQGFYILEEEKWNHLQFYIPFLCDFFQCTQVLNDLSSLLLKNQKISCNISEILIIFHKTFFSCTYCTMRLSRPIEEDGRKHTRVFLWKYDSISISITARAFLNISSFINGNFGAPFGTFGFFSS